MLLYPFTCYLRRDAETGGIPYAEVSGVARMERRFDGYWYPHSITLSARQGIRDIELCPRRSSRHDRQLFNEIALWLHEPEQRAEIDEEWREYMARQATKEVAA